MLKAPFISLEGSLCKINVNAIFVLKMAIPLNKSLRNIENVINCFHDNISRILLKNKFIFAVVFILESNPGINWLNLLLLL